MISRFRGEKSFFIKCKEITIKILISPVKQANMDKHTIKGFFSDRSELKMDDYVVFDYFFESFVDPEEAAAHLCQEQSTAQWKRPGVDEDLRGQFGAKVIDLAVEAVLEKPTMALPAIPDQKSYTCRAKIAHCKSVNLISPKRKILYFSLLAQS